MIFNNGVIVDRDVLEKVLIGGNHLASLLIGAGICDDSIESDDLLGHPLYDTHVVWKAIMELSKECEDLL